MDTSSRNTRIGAGFGVLAGLTALTSVAFACTTYMGDMTFAVPGPQTQTVTGAGAGMGMRWCGGDPPVNLSVASVPQALGITSGPSTNPSCPGMLPDGTYDIAHAPGYMGGNPSVGEHKNCHNESGNVLIGVYTVSGGNGAGSITAGGTWTPVGGLRGRNKGYVNVCVYQIPVISPGAPANDINMKVV